MKKVLGLDLGTTSIGWAMVNQADMKGEQSSIINVGVRVNPLTTDELGSFEKGKAITTNADRTLKRGMRRNQQRFKKRRDGLVAIMKREGWINDSTILSEEGKDSTYDILRLRAEAVTSDISLESLAKVFLSINKKRGYKSNRKTDKTGEGSQLDGMKVAIELHDRGLTPGAYSLELLKAGKKTLPDFYVSDLEQEYDRIWSVQKQFYPEILTDDFKSQLSNQGRAGTSRIFLGKYDIFTIDNKDKDRRINDMQWRSDALSNQLDKEKLAYVIASLRGELSGSSNYLGNISDHSKDLYFNHLTVGQYLYGNVKRDPNYSTKNVVFYRQDYIDEFEAIWKCQKSFHKEMTDSLKKEIRDFTIFYQRNLKSQKGLISFCEFEHHNIIAEGGQSIRVGKRVAPRSSLLFQEFKIWSILNNVVITDKCTGEQRGLSQEEKSQVAAELSIKVKIKASDLLSILHLSPRGYEINYKDIEGNSTMSTFYSSFLAIVSASGHGDYELNKLNYYDAKSIIVDAFSALNFKTDFLTFDSSLPKVQYEQQPLFKLWHLLYSYEGDNSKTGDESLIAKISSLCSMPQEYAKIISRVSFLDDYASLSHKAMSKILPFLKEGQLYSKACESAGYNHSNSETKDERDTKLLKDRLAPLPKGSLRNPVVEKILNQMISIINMAAEEYGKPDEIHIELSRELKQNQKQREKASNDIAENTRRNEDIAKILKDDFQLSYVSSNDLLRYRLYEELKGNGYHTLYSNKPISRQDIFSKNIDIEHILPQAILFNDSYSNKTLEFKDVNLEKGKQTAIDYVAVKYGDAGVEEYKARVEDLFRSGAISKTKHNNLLMKQSELPEDFINRDLTNSQYIASKAMEMLKEYVRVVVPTNGAITKKMREDWQLVDVLEELDTPKYAKVGRVHLVKKEDGSTRPKIDNWTKRNDHRHHAMDALTIAFTKQAHIQVLNNLSARDQNYVESTSFFKNKRILAPPMPLNELRGQFKSSLESVLVSIKAKNKVVTKNVNKIKVKDGAHKTEESTPRGQLHMEQVYGRRRVYKTEEKPVGSKMTAEIIATVASKREREALAARFEAFGGDPKKAFTGKNSLEKNPIYVDLAHKVIVPQKVRCVSFDVVFSFRKVISPDLSVDKVMDTRARKLIQARIDEFGGDKNKNKALANLDKKPIWFDESHHIPIKKVTISERFDLSPVRFKHDKDGHLITDPEGKAIPNDYVNMRNNHHIALYKDAKGDIQEVVVTFFEALDRINHNLPLVNKSYNSDKGWQFLFTLKKNEMFVFPNPKTGFDPKEIDLTDAENYAIISPNLFRVQKIGSKYYSFRHHLETTSADYSLALKDITWKRIQAISAMINAVKVRINHLGQIVAVGEYD